MGLFDKRSNKQVDPMDLDWGVVTPDGYDSAANRCLHVCNYDFTQATSREHAKQYLAGKLRWYARHLPEGCVQRVTLDLRGQPLTDDAFELQDQWRDSIREAMNGTVQQIDIII